MRATSILLMSLMLAVVGCGSSESPSGGVTPGIGTETGAGGIDDIVDTQQGSVVLESLELGVDLDSLAQLEAAPLPGPARKRCRLDGRSMVLGIERVNVRCFDAEALEDYFDVALFEKTSQAQEQANLYGADDKPVSSKGMPDETVCSTGASGGPREGIVYCDLLVDRKILLLTHSENGRSRKLMRFAFTWLKSAG